MDINLSKPLLEIQALLKLKKPNALKCKITRLFKALQFILNKSKLSQRKANRISKICLRVLT